MINLFKLTIYLKDFKKEYILGPIFKFTEVIFELLLPTIMALIINQGVAQRDLNYVIKMGGLMVVLALLGYGSAVICQFLASRASQGFGTVLRNRVFEHILSLSYTQVDQFGTSTLTNRITNDINQLQQMVAMSIRLVSRAPFIWIGSIIMSFLLDPQLALILLAATPVLAIVIYYLTKNAAPLYRAYQKKLDQLAALVSENLLGVRVIRAFAKNKQERRRFDQTNDQITDNGLAIGRISALFNPLTALVINLMVVLILWSGAIRIQSGRLSQGEMIAFINYVNQILVALLALSNLVILITKSIASAGRINEILETAPEVDHPLSTSLFASPLTPPPAAGLPAIEFRDVSFGYNQAGERVLEQISFEVYRGETLGIIGGTGAGKSTLINLVGRFYEPTSGSIYLDGKPATAYELKALRHKIGLVPQRAQLFTGTIRENIAWGQPQATQETIRQAAAIAQAEGFIQRLPEDFNTPIRRGGTNLSGGQRQRLTIARALAAQPEILIMDDASSALDFLTDAMLRRALRKYCAHQTVLLVSQRVGVVKNADRILVLTDGRLAGIGTHQELFKTCDTYRDICLSQISSEEALQ